MYALYYREHGFLKTRLLFFSQINQMHLIKGNLIKLRLRFEHKMFPHTNITTNPNIDFMLK